MRGKALVRISIPGAIAASEMIMYMIMAMIWRQQ